ncbi:signal peptidase I [Paraliobacillus quinghaiensis]|uniref:Signal peptidase I n=1 Tax=Paraliobacillus quinghaiensis TaxID=470815 RepID=A0A917TRH3_9BACI|nr:signal peptidase I [Paraliobacillus quinghaiensis]GGM33714.1 signal peptidase I [Paraliobacillus quinghaiensis]
MGSRFIQEVLSWLKAILIALVIVFVVREFIMTPSIVNGESMMPNLQHGDRIIISKVTSIERFDEVAFHAPDADENYVKRVIGLAGDTVRMEDDVLYINDKAYEEPYLDEFKQKLIGEQRLTNNFNSVVVPKGKLFVLGDNRRRSRDSREFGLISEEAVIGDVVFRIWPIDQFGIPK